MQTTEYLSRVEFVAASPTTIGFAVALRFGPFAFLRSKRKTKGAKQRISEMEGRFAIAEWGVGGELLQNTVTAG